MELIVLTFGRITDIAGKELTINGAHDTDSVKEILETKFPLLKDTKYIVAVDKKMVTGNTTLNKDSVVALMPPFSGG